MNRILANVRVYAESIGMHWDTSLNKDTAFWSTGTRFSTTSFATADLYETRLKELISYYYNKNVGFEYVNAIAAKQSDGEYLVTCYFG